MSDWYEDPNNVSALIRFLGDRAITVKWSPDDYAHLVEKPWHWSEEYEDMLRYEHEMGAAA